MAWNLGLLGAAGVASPGIYESLETTVLGTATTSVTFSNLNSTYGGTYQHLQIRMTTRSTRATGTDTNLDLVINGDTGSNYAFHQVYRTTALGAAGSASQNKIYLGPTAQSTSGSDVFGATIIDILDPFKTTKKTTVKSWGGFATASFMLCSGLWNNTNAVTSLQIICEPSNNFVAGSRFSLYGLRSA